MKKLFIPVFFCIFALSFIYATEIQADISENLLRMHIIANSNSQYDQSIKLFVRDELLKSTTENPDLSQLTQEANTALSKAGAGYNAYIKTERCYVPEKEYKNIKLPEGVYNCIKVVLGNGSGENWWCVAYPPLCFTEDVFGDMSDAAKRELSERLDKETLDTIIKNGDINFRFKIVEFFQKLRFS